MSASAELIESRSTRSASADAQPALRVAVVQGGRILQELVHHGNARISVGAAPSCSIILAEPRLPGRHMILTLRKGRMYVNLAPFMSLTWACGAQVTQVPAVQEGELTRTMLLPAGARGRIGVGDCLLLFQQVRVTPRPRPQLPASLRARAWDNVDRLFTSLLVIVVMLQAGLLSYLRSVDWPTPPAWEIQPDRIARVSVRPPAPVPSVIPKPLHPDPSQPQPDVPATSRAQRPVTSSVQASRTEERLQKVKEEVGKIGLVAIIAAKSQDGGFMADLLRNGSLDRDQEAALQNVGNLAVASGDERPSLELNTGGPARVVTPAALRGLAGPLAMAHVGPSRAERRVEPKVIADPATADVPGLPPGSLAKQLRPFMTGIRGCYERLLKNDPNLSGKLNLRLTLAEAGTVLRVEVEDQSINDPALGACIKALALRWRFSQLPPGGAEISFPLVFQASS